MESVTQGRQVGGPVLCLALDDGRRMTDRKRPKPKTGKRSKKASGAHSKGASGRKGSDGRKPHYTADKKPRRKADGKPHYTAETKPNYKAASKARYGAEAKPHYTVDKRPRHDSGGPSSDGPKRKFTRIDGLPGNVQEDLARVTPGTRVQEALEALRDSVKAYTKGQFRRALSAAERAKNLAPRDATVREIMGLSAYRSEEWKTALRELRTYRRLAGDVTHVPVEMDCLRAMGRSRDVSAAYAELLRRHPSPVVLKEGKVVYGSHLIDEGRPREAWAVAKPGRVVKEPFPEDLRVWFVAGRAAAALGDIAAATKLREAITASDPTFEGLALLDEEIARA